jgi:hypothetical protein
MRILNSLRAALVAAAIAMVPSVTHAQRPIPPRRPVREALKAQRQAQRADSGQPAPNDRVQLRQQVRRAWVQAVRKQLNLNDQQMRNLNQVNVRYDRQRAEVVRDERQARLGLKAAMEDTTAADQNARVEQQMNVLVQAQRRRADLFENEQKELAGFLTPLQRARFTVMQERLAARLQQLGTAATPDGPPPPDTPTPER